MTAVDAARLDEPGELEKLRERVADAIAAADDCTRAHWPGIYEARADAAITAMYPLLAAARARDELTEAVRALAEELGRHGDEEAAEGFRLRGMELPASGTARQYAGRAYHDAAARLAALIPADGGTE